MGILSILRHPLANKRLTMLAIMSIGAVAYFNFVTLFAMALATRVTISDLYANSPSSKANHYIFVFYMFVNTYWNYFMAFFTDTSTEKLQSDVREFHQKKDTRPRRCHSCKLCNNCIVKRDHHCFFMNTCIGYYNQKYFIWYCFHMTCGTFYSLITTAMYNNKTFGTQFSGSTTFFTLGPKTIFFWWIGRNPLAEMILVVYMYVCLGGGAVCLGFFLWQIWISCKGQTTYEAMNDIPGIDEGLYNNLTDVLGQYWLIGALLPTHWPQWGNGLYGNRFGVIDENGDNAKNNAKKGKTRDREKHAKHSNKKNK